MDDKSLCGECSTPIKGGSICPSCWAQIEQQKEKMRDLVYLEPSIPKEQGYEPVQMDPSGHGPMWA